MLLKMHQNKLSHSCVCLMTAVFEERPAYPFKACQILVSFFAYSFLNIVLERDGCEGGGEEALRMYFEA